jgi:hypothetical protein
MAEKATVASIKTARGERIETTQAQLWIHFGTEWRMCGFFDSEADAEKEMDEKWKGFRHGFELVKVFAMREA